MYNIIRLHFVILSYEKDLMIDLFMEYNFYDMQTNIYINKNLLSSSSNNNDYIEKNEQLFLLKK